MTRSEVFADAQLFATLDPTSRRLRLPIDQDVIINDTVGFIRDLPEDLVAAFRATLEEIEDSDLLVHVVDAANPQARQHIESVDKILSDLGFDSIPQLIVLNKADAAEPAEIEALCRQVMLDKNVDCVSISAVRSETLGPMIDKIGRPIARCRALQSAE